MGAAYVPHLEVAEFSKFKLRQASLLSAWSVAWLMSTLSSPSLTSDSSSLSRGSDIDELTHERLSLASLTTNPTASIPLPPRDVRFFPLFP